MSSFNTLPSPPAKRLEGKVALITGGASGIGAATARLFARHGAKVIIADIQDELGHSVSSQISSTTGQPVTYVHCDVSRDPDVENAVNTAVSMHKKLDIMFNNAGIVDMFDPTMQVDHQVFKKVCDVNIYGPLLGAKHAARVMIPQKKGSILFTSSSASVACGGGEPLAYTASKHAVAGLTKKLCVELGQYGIRVNCISPSAIPTPMFSKWMDGADREVMEAAIVKCANLKGVVLGEDDIAEAALYLGSDESKYVSGVNLVVDGGFSARNYAMGESNEGLRSGSTS